MWIPARAIACVLAVAAGCAGRVSSPPPTVPHVDLARYAGRWYEIARLPTTFQRSCARSWADYALDADGRVRVRNTCGTVRGGERSIEGHARIVDAASNAKLLVTFDTWFGWALPRPAAGNYWILALDDAYETALVGTPDREYLWILARTAPLPSDRESALIRQAERLGFDTSRLVRASWPEPPGAAAGVPVR